MPGPARHAAHDQRLDQTVLADALCQLLELLRVEVLPRLPLLRLFSGTIFSSGHAKR
jgi:hypothetical protein